MSFVMIIDISMKKTVVIVIKDILLLIMETIPD